MNEKMLDKIYFSTFEEAEYNREDNKICRKAEGLYGDLKKNLPEKQMEKLIKLEDLYYDMQAVATCIFFKHGFKIAYRLVAECFN